MNGPPVRVVVLGAGPVGLEAAARALDAGHQVSVLERAEPGAHLQAWGHVRLFTPFGMNTGEAGSALLKRRRPAARLPDAEALLTGREFREAYLLPLADTLAGDASLLTGATVVSVSRSTLLKNELPPRAERAADPFRVLFRHADEEREMLADVVLDCTGTYGCHNWLGSGGAPARGERALAGRIEYGLPDPVAAERSRYAGRRTLLVGSGHSAATTAVALAELARQEPGTSFCWVTRSMAERPVLEIPNDNLPARADLTARANAVAGAPPPDSVWRPGGQVAALETQAADRGGSNARGETFVVTLRFGAGGGNEPHMEDARFDRIVANIGHEPDDGPYRQLQIHECYASRGPMSLSAALLGATAESADCLTVGGFGPEVLENPEPNFFILGIKSYGKNPAFLLRAGYEQVRDALGILQPTSGSAA